VQQVAAKVHVRHPRCPFCHDRLSPDAPRLACNACGAWHHRGCWAEGGCCAACQSDETGLPRPPSPGEHVRLECFDCRRVAWAPTHAVGAMGRCPHCLANVPVIGGPDAGAPRQAPIALVTALGVSAVASLCLLLAHASGLWTATEALWVAALLHPAPLWLAYALVNDGDAAADADAPGEVLLSPSPAGLEASQAGAREPHSSPYLPSSPPSTLRCASWARRAARRA
jgi:hypothetical protein